MKHCKDDEDFMQAFSCNYPLKIIDLIDETVRLGYFPNRSEGFRHCIAEYILQSPTFLQIMEESK